MGQPGRAARVHADLGSRLARVALRGARLQIGLLRSYGLIFLIINVYTFYFQFVAGDWEHLWFIHLLIAGGSLIAVGFKLERWIRGSAGRDGALPRARTTSPAVDSACQTTLRFSATRHRCFDTRERGAVPVDERRDTRPSSRTPMCCTGNSLMPPPAPAVKRNSLSAPPE